MIFHIFFSVIIHLLRGAIGIAFWKCPFGYAYSFITQLEFVYCHGFHLSAHWCLCGGMLTCHGVGSCSISGQ